MWFWGAGIVQKQLWPNVRFSGRSEEGVLRSVSALGTIEHIPATVASWGIIGIPDLMPIGGLTYPLVG